jgi:hypothetical protein
MGGRPGSEQALPVGLMPSSWFRNTPLSPEQFPIIADPVANLNTVLTPTVGNSQGLDCDGNWVGHRDAAAGTAAEKRTTGVRLVRDWMRTRATESGKCSATSTQIARSNLRPTSKGLVRSAGRKQSDGTMRMPSMPRILMAPRCCVPEIGSISSTP